MSSSRTTDSETTPGAVKLRESSGRAGGFPVGLKFAFALFVAASAQAEGLTNFYSFAAETKIKGPMTVISNEIYFACDKGGAFNFGSRTVV